MHSPFDLLAVLLVMLAGLAYLNYRFMKLPMTVGLLVGAAAGTLVLIAMDDACRASALSSPSAI